MKLTESQLKKIIQEELQQIMEQYKFPPEKPIDRTKLPVEKRLSDLEKSVFGRRGPQPAE